MNVFLKGSQGLMDRRSFLKKTGTGILGAAVCSSLPFKALTFEEAIAEAGTTGEKVVPTFCGMCGPTAGCGVYAFTKNGVFTKVAGMKESPINEGSICAKGQSAPQWVYSPDRLTHPLRRVGKKGEGKFQS